MPNQWCIGPCLTANHHQRFIIGQRSEFTSRRNGSSEQRRPFIRQFHNPANRYVLRVRVASALG